jgi:hypothetical protein
VAEEEQTAPRRARGGNGRQEQAPPAARENRRPRDEQESDERDEEERRRRAGGENGARPTRRAATAPTADLPERPAGAIPASAAARRAAENVAEFTGRRPENVVAIERRDGDWYVDVEVVETHRIPDTTDILAIYQVQLDRGGRLLSYRRTRRYARGQLDKESR